MKRILTISAFALAGGAAAIWFGVPVYAEKSYKAALDAHFASKTDPQAGYTGAKLDYWSDRAEIGTITDVASFNIGGKTLRAYVTFENIVFKGYDIKAAESAISGADGNSERIADTVSWSGFTVSNKDGAGVLTGGAGELQGVHADQLDLDDLLQTVDAKFSAVNQMDLRIEWAEGPNSVELAIGTISGSDLAGSRTAAAQMIDAKLDISLGKDDAQGAVTATWADTRLQGIANEALLTIDQIDQSDFTMKMQITDPKSTQGAKAAKKPETVNVNAGYKSYSLEKLSFDRSIFAIYPKILEMMERGDEEPSPAELANLTEMLVQMMERAVSLNTGADRFVMEGMSVDIAGLQQQTLERAEARGYRGLKIAHLEMNGLTQVDAMATESTVDRITIDDFDISALPAYLRKVLGDEVTPASLQHAQSFYQNNTIAAAIPTLDFGRWNIQNQTAKLADGTAVHFDHIGMDAMKSSPDGTVSWASDIAGMTLPLDQIAKRDPKAAMALGMLKAHGIEDLKIGYGIDISASPAAGTVQIGGVNVALAKLGNVSLAGNISGVDVEALRHMPERERPGALMASEVGDVVLQISDEGIRAIAFEVLGQQRGAKPDQVAAGLAMQAEQMAAQFSSPRATALGKAIGVFLKDGGTIKISAAKKPAALMSVMMAMQTQGPPAVLNLLEIEAVHTP